MSKFTKKFEVQKMRSQEGIVLLLSGAIMEDSVFPMELIDNVQVLNLDFKEVSRINSSGIRLWIQWMGGIKALNPDVVLVVRHCQKVFVDLMNSFRDFVPSPFIVQSFYVPFFCHTCDEFEDRLFVRHTDFNEMAENPEQVTLPKVTCPKCKGAMEADIFPETYFRFLKNAKQSIAKI